MKLEDRSIIIVGAGQTPGDTLGNGRATSLLFAREGANLLLVDRDIESARKTRSMIRSEGFDAEVCEADVLQEEDCQRFVDYARKALGGIDCLHYNVGLSQGDNEISRLEAVEWDKILAINLRGFFLSCKYVLPIMRGQGGGTITAISSAAALASTNSYAYKASKAGMNALVQSMAVENGQYGIRVNAIMPGLMDTPMAIERRAREQGISQDEVRSARDRMVPLNRKMGSAWDVAKAALFLTSDDAAYISGIALAVDGGVTARIG